MEIYNSTIYDYTAFVNGTKYELKGLSSICFHCTENTKVELISKKQNSVKIDWLDIILFKMIFGTSSVTNIYPDYSFEINNAFIDKITLEYNDFSPANNVSISACCTSIEMKDEEYKIINIDKLKKDHRIRQLLITSALPVDIVFLILIFIIESSSEVVIILALFLLFFTIPSFREIHRYKKIMKAEELNEKLLLNGIQRRKNGFKFEDNSFSGKIVKKLFNIGKDKK